MTTILVGLSLRVRLMCFYNSRLSGAKYRAFYRLKVYVAITQCLPFPVYGPGADPGFRRGWGVVHSEGGGGLVGWLVGWLSGGFTPCRHLRGGGRGVRTGISGADPNCCRALGKSTSKKNCRQP